MAKQKKRVGYNSKSETKNPDTDIDHDTLRRAEAEARFMLELQLEKLEVNKHKDPWWLCSLRYLLSRLEQEREELEYAVREYIKHPSQKNAFAVAWEVADVQNFGTFIAANVLLMDRYRLVPGEDILDHLLNNNVWQELLELIKREKRGSSD